MPSSLSQIDHLIYTTPKLKQGIAEIEQLTGTSVQAGGVHKGRGTHNALLSLGDSCYLEIIAPDPMQTVEEPLWMGLDGIKKSCLSRWAAKSSDLDLLQQKALTHHLNIGGIQNGKRNLPDGKTLKWQLSDPKAVDYQGVFPFFIDWSKSVHPEWDLPSSCKLLAFWVEHPEAEALRRDFKALDIRVMVKTGKAPVLRVRIKGLKGEFTF